MKGVLGSLAGLRSTSDRPAANYRYYCDNDERGRYDMELWRWTLRPDPDFPPSGYIRQRDRPSYPERAFQEWEDRRNGILMGRDTNSCQRPPAERQASTYRQHTYEDPLRLTRPIGQPLIRATVTVSIPSIKAYFKSQRQTILTAPLIRFAIGSCSSQSTHSRTCLRYQTSDGSPGSRTH